MTTMRMTTRDLEVFPQPFDDTRYEIIDGELYVSTQPRLEHQFAASVVCSNLHTWSMRTGLGFAFFAPGVIFADDDNVAPDVIWISQERLRTVVEPDGKLHGAPELVVEVLSPGAANERRDREVKLKLYSRRDVDEYWIADCLARAVDVYRKAGGALRLAARVTADENLTSPLLPGFQLRVGEIFLLEAF